MYFRDDNINPEENLNQNFSNDAEDIRHKDHHKHHEDDCMKESHMEHCPYIHMCPLMQQHYMMTEAEKFEKHDMDCKKYDDDSYRQRPQYYHHNYQPYYYHPYYHHPYYYHPYYHHPYYHHRPWWMY
ncbi:MAG: hypothetical protein Q8936_11740 [Bacillota bacterium]|nr:hypothetical protein [Bacillota bacterium]